jgi:hypothetical protein
VDFEPIRYFALVVAIGDQVRDTTKRGWQVNFGTGFQADVDGVLADQVGFLTML